MDFKQSPGWELTCSKAEGKMGWHARAQGLGGGTWESPIKDWCAQLSRQEIRVFGTWTHDESNSVSPRFHLPVRIPA